MAAGLDLAFIAGIVNKLDGDFVVGRRSSRRRISKENLSVFRASAAAFGRLRCWLSIIGGSCRSATKSNSVSSGDQAVLVNG